LRINPWDRGVLLAEAWERQTGLEIGGAAAVVVALLDGRRISGKIAKFSPQMPDLMIEADADQKDKLKSPRLRAEELAYIGFVRGNEAMAPIPNGYERWRVRVAGVE
jgi:hypothetical protein